ncbi:MAG: hypothetical protein ACSHX0_07820 [Akkermansiaceae bacterium]
MSHSINIDRMKLTLPEAWRGRERTFARLLAQELGRLPVSASQHLESLSIQPIQARSGESYTIVAKRVAQQIHQQIHQPQVSNVAATVAGTKNNKVIS